MQISCLVCDEEFSLSEKLHEEFDGEVKCPKCGSRLHVATKDGKIRRLRVVKEGTKKGEETLRELANLVNKERSG
jgi:transcription initiation factor IIE alpha subunit